MPFSAVFVNGCFDGLHLGHIRFLEYAAGRGDFLFVALATDEVCAAKGENRPVYPSNVRAEVLRALRVVDSVKVGSPQYLLHTMPFDLYVKGDTQDKDDADGMLAVEMGIEVLQTHSFGDFSTASLLKSIRA